MDNTDSILPAKGRWLSGLGVVFPDDSSIPRSTAEFEEDFNLEQDGVRSYSEINTEPEDAFLAKVKLPLKAQSEEIAHSRLNAVDEAPAKLQTGNPWLDSLGNGPWGKYVRSGAYAADPTFGSKVSKVDSDLDQSIEDLRTALGNLMDDNQNRAKCMNTLGSLLMYRYLTTKDSNLLTKRMKDYDDSIDIQIESLRLGFEENFNRESLVAIRKVGKASVNDEREVHLKTFAGSSKRVCGGNDSESEQFVLKAAYNEVHRRNEVGLGVSWTTEVVDIEKFVRVAREEADKIPEGHPERMRRLNILAAGLTSRYFRMEQIKDLEEWVQIRSLIVHEALQDLPEQWDRAQLLHDLGCALEARYLRKGAVEDLDESIRTKRHMMLETRANHPGRITYLSALSNGLSRRYVRTGAIADLEETIGIRREAVNARRFQWDGVKHLSALGDALWQRYQKMGSLVDLEESIQFEQDSINAISQDNITRPQRLSNVEHRLKVKYSRLKAEYLDDSVRNQRNIADKMLPNDLYQPQLLSHLGYKLRQRILETRSNLEESIELVVEAIDVTPYDHPNRTHLLHMLGGLLETKYFKTNSLEYLESSITFGQQALNTLPEDHADRVKFLVSLGSRLKARYSETRETEDLRKGLSYYRSALRQSNSPASIRISAGKEALRLSSFISDWQQAFEDSNLAVQLTADLALRPLEHTDKQHTLSQVAGLACNAAALALQTGKAPITALKLLEQGRGLLSSSVEEVRTDIDILEENEPYLAYQFKNLRIALESDKPQPSYLLSETRTAYTDARSDWRYTAGKEFDDLMVQIRKKPKFENFLLYPSEEEIRSATARGPIAVINVSDYRCDALLIEQSRIRSLPLPRLNNKDIRKKAQKDLRDPRILKWLWEAVANPVLDALGLTEVYSGRVWPHIWWILAGSLSKFPIHAAGLYGDSENLNQTVLDRVMSSYSSSVKAIIDGRRRKAKYNPSNVLDKESALDQALLVAVPQAPGLSALTSATKEIQDLSILCKTMRLDPVTPGPYKQDVTAHLAKCRIFHFAGHGTTNNTDPLKSQLLLQDWQSSPLTVGTLLEMNLRDNSPFLAYLSACGTGQIKQNRFLDEHVHLIVACQLAGFRHVIGTLWKVEDKCCVEIATTTYKEIGAAGMTDDSVCLGLHIATRELRSRWMMENGLGTGHRIREGRRGGRCPRKPVLYDSDEEDGVRLKPAHWVPYVHFGM